MIRAPVRANSATTSLYGFRFAVTILPVYFYEAHHEHPRPKRIRRPSSLRHTYGTPRRYDRAMGQHHNPLDPRDPLSPALYFTLIDSGNGGSRRGGPRQPGSGCGCLVILITIVLVLIISSLTWR